MAAATALILFDCVAAVASDSVGTRAYPLVLESILALALSGIHLLGLAVRS